MESKNAPLFLVSKAVCHSSGAGCGCDPCLRLAIGERACLCVGSGDDCCCRRHNHAGAFSFSRYGLIARREKPLPTRAPSGVRLLVAVPHPNILCAHPQHPRQSHPRPHAAPAPWTSSSGPIGVSVRPTTISYRGGKLPRVSAAPERFEMRRGADLPQVRKSRSKRATNKRTWLRDHCRQIYPETQATREIAGFWGG
jgi:hypothetical protein